MRIAAAYIRVSTSDQLEYSPDSQLRLIRDYAKRNELLLDDIHVYADEGISGRKAEKRPQFQKMFADGKRKEFEVILIYNTSRFARNHEESVVYRAMLRREGIEVISITQPNIDEKTDLLMNALYAVMDERYSLELSENVKRGMTEKAMRGETVNSVPYGYRIAEPKKTPQIIDSEAEIVKSVFKMYLEGKPSRAISIHLNDLGVLTARGKQWTREGIDRMLVNSFYCGYTRYNLRYSDTKKLKDESEHIIRKGKHTPIITEEMHQEVLIRMRKNHRNEKPTNIRAHWLSGIIICEACGSRLNVVLGTTRERKPFLRCRGYAFGRCKETQYTSAALIESYLNESLRAVLIHPEYAMFEAIPDSRNDDRKQKVISSIQRAKKKLDRVKSAYENGIDSMEEYKQNKQKITTEINDLSQQLQEIEDIESTEMNKKAQERFCASINDLIELLHSDADIETKHSAIKNIISKVVYSKKNKTFHVFYFAP